MRKTEKNIKIIPLGGCGEIGMNMTLFSVEGRWFFVDGGALFPDPTHMGVDLILPETSFIDDNEIRPDAWLITHGHEDHIGALPHLFKKYPAPIYGTEFTIELIKAKFIDANINDAVYNVWKVYTPTLFRNMKVTPFPVNHSIADAAGLFFETPMGNILHMGDFRIDYAPPEHSMTHENLEKVLAGKPVTLMMSDSTNSFQLGLDKSETQITPAFVDYFTKQEGAVIIATFASNIWRLQSVFEAAQSTDRKIVLFGRTMFRNVEIAQKLGLLNFNPDLLLSLYEINTIPRNRVCILCTGSQGEMFSGLHRLAWGNVSDFQITSYDTVLLSSRIIPGNEKTIDAMVTQLIRIGCNVVTTREDPFIHVSGHGYAEDLKTCIKVAKPYSFMPVHGTYKHLKRHRELAIECGVLPENCFLVENGDVVLAAPEPQGVIDRIASGRDYVCPGGILSQHSGIYKDRVALVRTGVIAVSFIIHQSTYKLAANPTVALKGLQFDENAVLKKMPRIYEYTFDSVSKRKRFDESILQEELRVAIRKYLENIYGFKTTVIVLFHKV